MEGNTLTIEETKSVMIGIINVNNKSIKDVREMEGHDKAIQTILKIGKGELNISESRIRDIHKQIMFEETSSEKEKIGEWKKTANHIYNYKNEKFDFTQPIDVSEEMHKLVNWVNAEKGNIENVKVKSLHPVELAFEFHLRYLTIHPFYDGNGRTARILTNLILISYGYPPIYVRDEDKALYYQALGNVQGYEADKYFLFDLMVDYLKRSLNMVLDAINGKDINEPTDLDKKLQLLEISLNSINDDDNIKVRFSKEVFLEMFHDWIVKLNGYVIPVIQKFNKFFNGVNHQIHFSSPNVFQTFEEEPISVINEKLGFEFHNKMEDFNSFNQVYSISTFYGSFIKGGLKTFGCRYSLKIKFDDIKYEVFVDGFDEVKGERIEMKIYERLLHKSLFNEQMQNITDILGDTIYKHIAFYMKKNEIEP
jgi:fido (protein-threonine AMPylation protein)